MTASAAPHYELNRLLDYSDAALLDELRRVAALTSAELPLTRRRFDGLSRMASAPICIRFGTWRAALQKAGLGARIGTLGGKAMRYTAELCLENLKTLWRHHGRQPVSRETYAPPSTIGAHIYFQRFGSWRQTLVAFLDWTRTGRLPPSNEPGRPATMARPRYVPASLRHAVLKRDRYICRACGASPAKDPAVTLHIDHIVPIDRGGTSAYENLQTLCARCNRGKGNKEG